MRSFSGTQSLRHLCRLYGVQTAYYDVGHRRRQATVESLVAVLRSLGAPIVGLEDAPEALRERRGDLWRQIMEPVVVAWDGWAPTLELRLSSAQAHASLAGCLMLEDGGESRWTWSGGDLPVVGSAEIEGTRYVAKKLSIPVNLPPGYHRFRLDVGGTAAETLVIAAPLRAYGLPGDSGSCSWGVFLPLYSLYKRESWGSGDFSSMGEFMAWVAEQGGGVVATLPLLAAYLEEPFAPSPYAPVSRLFWNEFYVDVTAIPEMQGCRSARELVASHLFQKELKSLRSGRNVDYRRQMRLKRRVLEELVQYLPAGGSERYSAFRRFVESNPAVEDYARFRAAVEHQKRPWPAWPERLRGGVLEDGDYDETAKLYHMYAQWVTHEQFERLCASARDRGQGLYLDMPLGVHHYGYDVWRERDTFPPDISAGAPPDAVFTGGQTWAFPPLHPHTMRQQGYRYLMAVLRRHLEHATMLRIDHVMGLHRLFWIPKDMEPAQGVYVRYNAEELYAILTLESHRNRAAIVGEDLGTVPPYVRPAMRQHGLYRTYVVQYELISDKRRGLSSIPRDAVASLNTHDMPPFAAFWRGLDVEERRVLGLLDGAMAHQEAVQRKATRQALVDFLRRRGLDVGGGSPVSEVLNSLLVLLGASRARVLLVNLEDLWRETKPQNVPGVEEGLPNWCRKARHGFEVFSGLPGVVDSMRRIDRVRRERKDGLHGTETE